MKMKKTIPVVAVLALLICGVVYAKNAGWKNTDKPAVSLRLALALADTELEKEDAQYFCIGASLARTFTEGDWELRYSSKEGKEMWVSVGSDKSIRKSKEAFGY